MAGNQLSFVSGAKIELPFPIGNAIKFGDILVVRLEPTRGTIFNENVYRYGRDGCLIWQIRPEYPPNWDGAWGGLEDINGVAVLSNSESKYLHINPSTGAVLKRGMQVR